MIAEIKRRFRKTVGFRFDAMAVFLVCQQHKVDLSELDKIPKEIYLNSLIWSAHRSYCIDKNRITLTDCKGMERFVNRLRKKEWDIIIEAMLSARSEVEGDKKKVQPGMNSLSQDGRQD